MQSSVTIKRDNTDAGEKYSKGKSTFKQRHRHWTHKLNEALTGYTIPIWVWGWVKLFVILTQGNMQTKLKMEIKSLQTTVSPSSIWLRIWPSMLNSCLYHGKNISGSTFLCFKNECPDSWLKQLVGRIILFRLLKLIISSKNYWQNFLSLYINLFKHLLNVYSMPGTELGTWYIKLIRTCLCSKEAYGHKEELKISQHQPTIMEVMMSNFTYKFYLSTRRF